MDFIKMSELASQLEALKPLSLPHGTQPSFLFDIKEASKIDKETIYTIGFNGLEELRRVDLNFLTFYSDLFQESYANSHSCRDALHKSQIQHLDEELSSLLKLLAPHFLHTGCHKVLEFLLRFYSIHVYKREEMLLYFLPYHDTKYYIRLLQLCKLENSQWEFLKNHREQGYIITRSQVIKRACQDLSLLSGIMKTSSLGLTHMRFAGVVCLEVIHSIGQLSSSFLYLLLPFVTQLLQEPEEQKHLAYSLVVRLSLRQGFSPQYLHAFIKDILVYAEETLKDGLATVTLLMHVHNTHKLPKDIIEFFQEKAIESLGRVSQQFDVTPVVLSLSKKLVGDFLKSDQQLLKALIQKVTLSKDASKDLMFRIFEAYLNSQKKVRKERFQALTDSLNSLWQQYGELLTSIIPECIEMASKSHPGSKTKKRLYKLVSQGFSGVPFEEFSDLPLVMALNHPSPEIRISALSKASSHIENLESSLFLLLSNETQDSVLLEALHLPLTRLPPAPLYNVLKDLYFSHLSRPLQNTQILQLLFKWLCIELPKLVEVRTEHIRLICKAYDMPGLRELVSEAVLEGRDHELLKGYKGSDLSLYLKKWLSKNWKTLYPYAVELLDCDLIKGLVPEVLVELEKNKEACFEEILLSSQSLVGKIVNLEIKDFEILEGIVRACPSLKDIKSKEHRSVASEMLKTMVAYLIPLSADLCKEILNKHFDQDIIKVLLEISQNSPEALHLAVCFAYSSETPNAFLQCVPYLLLNLGRGPEFRSSAVLSLENYFHKTLPSVELECQVRKNRAFEQYESKMHDLRKFLVRLLKNKAGLLQDPDYVTHALGRISKPEFYNLLAEGFSCLLYERPRYLCILSGIKEQTLTEKLVSLTQTTSEHLTMISRLHFYTNWSNPEVSKYLLQYLDEPSLLHPTVEILSPQMFLSLSNVEDFFLKLVLKLPGLEVPTSMLVHEKLSEIKIQPNLIAKAIETSSEPKHLESVLEVAQYSGSSPEVVEALFKLLNLEDSYLTQLVLVALRVHVKRSAFELTDFHLEKIMKVIKPESSLQLKQQTFMTLANFAQEHPAKVLEFIQHALKISHPELASKEFNLYTSTVSALSKALKPKGYSLETLVAQLLKCASDSEDYPKIVHCSGTEYLHLVVKFLVGNYNLAQSLLFKFEFEAIKEAVLQILSTINSESTEELNFLMQLFSNEYFLELIAKNKHSSYELVSSTFYYLFALKQKSFKKLDRKLKIFMKVLKTSINDKTLSGASKILLQKSETKEAIQVKKDFLEFLIDRLDNSEAKLFEGLVSPLCAILELYVSRTSVLYKARYESRAIYLQLVLSLLYKLMKHSTEPLEVLGVYGNVLLGFTWASHSEVQSSACLVFSVFFEEKSIEVLPFLEAYIKNLLSLLENEDSVVVDCGKYCLSALIAGAQEFLSPYIEDIVLKVVKLKDSEHLLDIVPKAIPHRTLIQALPSLSKAISEPSQLKNFYGLVKQLFVRVKQADISAYSETLLSFFKNSLVMLTEQNLKLKPSLDLAGSVTSGVSELALSLTPTQFKPLFLEVLEWALEKTPEEDYNFQKLLGFFSLTNCLVSKLKGIFVEYLGYFLEVMVEVLSKTFEAFKEVTKKRKRNQTKKQLTINSLVLEFIQKCAVHDKDTFITDQKFEKLTECISSQLKMVGLKEKYLSYSETHTIPALKALVTSTHDRAQWQSVNYKILLNTRSEHSEVRKASLLCIQSVLEEIGKDYASLLPDIMPFVLGSLEDPSEGVVTHARAILRQLEVFCGDELKQYLT